LNVSSDGDDVTVAGALLLLLVLVLSNLLIFLRIN